MKTLMRTAASKGTEGSNILLRCSPLNILLSCRLLVLNFLKWIIQEFLALGAAVVTEKSMLHANATGCSVFFYVRAWHEHARVCMAQDLSLFGP